MAETQTGAGMPVCVSIPISLEERGEVSAGEGDKQGDKRPVRSGRFVDLDDYVDVDVDES